MDHHLYLGLILRKLRVAKGYSQQYVANYMDISRNAYIAWENNKVNLTLEHIIQICILYDIKPSSFVEEYVEKGLDERMNK